MNRAIEDLIKIASIEGLDSKSGVAARTEALQLWVKANIVEVGMEQAIINGRSLLLPDIDSVCGQWCRAYSGDGRLIALLRYDKEQRSWHPRKVFAGPIKAS